MEPLSTTEAATDRHARILDGVALAARRAPLITERAAAVAQQRGAPPSLLIVAFAETNGRVLHVARKLRACAAAGVEVQQLVFPHATTTADATQRLHDTLAANQCDGVFLQFPFPDHIDGEAMADAVPRSLDVDVMTTSAVTHYFAHRKALPPVTVTAALTLLDAYQLTIVMAAGIVVAEPSPFAAMFREALARRGAQMAHLISPGDPALLEQLAAADLAVIAAARPGCVQTSQLKRDAIAIDVGYFNPGGKGDIDASSGIHHLRALSPVPGGIGPMTVSALIERVIIFAEKNE